MLEAIRHRLTGWVAIVILGVIALALVVSFGNMDSGVNPDSVVAEVNGEKISVGEFQQALDAQLQRFQVAGGEVPPAIKAQLSQSVLEGLINNRLLLQYVADAGYRVSDRIVADAIRAVPAFVVDGQFSQQTYEALLLSQGMSPQRFEQLQRRVLETQQFQAAIAGTAFVTPTDYRRFLELEGEQRDADYVLFEPAAFIDSVEIADDDIAQYYELNALDFQTPETADVEFVEIRLAGIAASTEISEEELQTYYDENADRFRSETERNSSHILISSDELSDEEALALANELTSKLNSGEGFVALAKEYSDDPGSAAAGGDLGWSTSGVFVPEFEEALFALNIGEVSLPVRTQFGYHLIRLDDIREGQQQPLAEVRDELVDELSRNLAEDEFYSLSERLDDLALESLDGLQPVAEDMGLSLVEVVGVTRSGAAGLPVSEPLINAIFSLEVLEDGENTPLIEIEPGHVVVARVSQYNLPQQLPLEDVRIAIQARLAAEEAGRQAVFAGEQMLEQLQAGEAFVAAAGDNGGAVLSEPAIVRGAQELSPLLVNAIFSVPRPAAAPSVDSVELTGGGMAVFQVNEVRPGRPENLDRELRDQQKAQLTDLVGQSQLAALVEELRDSANVKVFNDVLQGQDGV